MPTARGANAALTAEERKAEEERKKEFAREKEDIKASTFIILKYTCTLNQRLLDILVKPNLLC